jgi:SOS-response transcriptional repressor LexA
MDFYHMDGCVSLGSQSKAMTADLHLYYAGLRRWIDAQSKYTLSSLAKASGLDSSTLLHAVKKGTAPSQTTIDKIRMITGLGYEDVIQLNYDTASPPIPPGMPARPGPAKRPAFPIFSPSDAVVWAPGPDDRAQQHVEDTAAQLAEAKGGRDIWQVTARAMVMEGYAVGDFLLVDPNAQPTAGDVVLAEVYDLDSRGELTKLRRYEPPLLVTASPDPRDVPYVISPSAKIIGVITASWRTK